MGYKRKLQQKQKDRARKESIRSKGNRQLQKVSFDKPRKGKVRESADYSLFPKQKEITKDLNSPALKNFLGDLKISEFKRPCLDPDSHLSSHPSLRTLVQDIHKRFSSTREFSKFSRSTFQPDTINKLRLIASDLHKANDDFRVRLMNNPHGGGLIKFVHPMFTAAAQFAAPHVGYLLMKGINYLVSRFTSGSIDQKTLLEDISRIAFLESKIGKSSTEKKLKQKEEKKEPKKPKKDKKKKEDGKLQIVTLSNQPQSPKALSLLTKGRQTIAPRLPAFRNHRGPQISSKFMKDIFRHEAELQERMNKAQPEIGLIDLIRVDIQVPSIVMYTVCYHVTHFLNTLIPSQYTAAEWGEICAALINDMGRAIEGQVSLIPNMFRSWWWIRNSLSSRVWNNVSYQPEITSQTIPDPSTLRLRIGQFDPGSIVYGNNSLPSPTIMLASDVLLTDQSYDLLADALAIVSSLIEITPNHGNYGFIWGGALTTTSQDIFPALSSDVQVYPGAILANGSLGAIARLPMVFPFEPKQVDIGLSSLGFALRDAVTKNFDYKTPGKLHLALASGSTSAVINHMLYCDRLKFSPHLYGSQIRYVSVELNALVNGYLNLISKIAIYESHTMTCSAQEHAAAAVLVCLEWFKNWAWAVPSYTGTLWGIKTWQNTYTAGPMTTPVLQMENFVFPIYLLNALYKFAPKVKEMEGSISFFYPTLVTIYGPGNYVNTDYGSVFAADASPNNYYTTFSGSFGFWSINQVSNAATGIWNDFAWLASRTPMARLPVFPSKFLVTTYVQYQANDESVSLLTPGKLSLKKRSRLNLETLPVFACDENVREEVMAYLDLDHELSFDDEYTSQLEFSYCIDYFDWYVSDSKPIGPDAMMAVDLYISTQDPQFKQFLTANYSSVTEGLRQSLTNELSRTIAKIKLDRHPCPKGIKLIEEGTTDSAPKELVDEKVLPPILDTQVLLDLLKSKEDPELSKILLKYV